MRPIELRLCAFGSYADDEVIDFAALAEYGLFLVTGPTGGGKTTLFDAMAFALYGKLPGDRPADVRSHHAAPPAICEVEFVFEIERCRYRVVRRPAQDRPKRRGVGVTAAPAEAELYEWTDGGWQGCLTGAVPVATRLTELMGLDVEQFQRVVLLPQGKFAEFLLADTGKRQALLRQLFGTDLYDRVALWLRDEVQQLTETVRDADGETDHQRRIAAAALGSISDELGAESPVQVTHDVGLDELEGVVGQLAPVVTRRRLDHDELERGRDQLARQAAAALDAALRFDQDSLLRVEHRLLVGEAEAIARAASQLDAARRAAPVVIAASRREATTARAACTGTDVACAVAQVEAQGAHFGLEFVDDPMVMVGAVAGVRVRLAADIERLRVVRDLQRAAVDIESDVEQATAEVAAASAALDGVHDRLVEVGSRRVLVDKRAGKRTALAETATNLGTVVAARHRLDVLAVQVQSVLVDEADACDHERDLVVRFAAGVAPRLAADLRPGEPCAVCGGRDHPAPARALDHGSLVDPNELEAARAAADRLRELRVALQTELLATSAALGADADRFLELVEHELAEVQARLVDADRAVRELVRIDAEIGRLQTTHAAADERLHTADVALAAHRARRDVAVDARERAVADSADLDAEQITADGRLLDELEVDVASWGDRAAAAARAATEHELAQIALDDALSMAGLGDVTAAAVAARSDEVQIQLDRQVAQHRSSLERVVTSLAQLAGLGVPAERPEAETLQDEAERLARSVAAGAATVANLERALVDARAALAAARVVATGSAPMREQLTITRKVMATCTGAVGPGGQRITLETWVLAAELDRVTEAATVHLRRLSNGRYELRRGAPIAAGNRRTGLDLTLFDAYTGRERSPRTLSGGEQFQASLALALGLADVVSRGGTGSGRLFEALFVDEGFGSLDPTALDDAIGALQQLQATGRMVGVITHVEAMKHQIPVGIAVEHRADGRGSRIVPKRSQR